MIATLDELEVRLRSGQGLAVIVEGSSYEEDPWFYGQWFNYLARQIAFFPQNGWPRVIEAVRELRRRCPDVPIYGIIDRDFAEDEALDADFDRDGILRTPCYTLENYLLDPECWAKVFRFIFRRQGRAPDGWDDLATVQVRVEQAYRFCLPLAAHNYVIKYGCTLYPVRAAQTPETERTYREHPDALARLNVFAKLRAWGEMLGATEDLGALYEKELDRLEQGGFSVWQRHVSGKYVLAVLHRDFPRLPRSGQFSVGHYLNLYLDRCPQPPADVQRLIERILRHAATITAQ